MIDEELVTKLAQFELDHWDLCIRTVIENLNKHFQSGMTMEGVMNYLQNDFVPTPLNQMTERGQQFHKDHAKKVLELIKQWEN